MPISTRRRMMMMGSPDNAPLTLTATTTGAAETATIQRLSLRVDTVVNWGDGSSTALPANTATTITHVYASAGTYNISIPRAMHIWYLDLRDARLGGLNTNQMRRCTNVNTFYLSGLSKAQVVNSADMVGWTLSYQFTLSALPGMTGVLNSADMTGWTLSYQFYLYGLPGMTGVLNSADMTGWTLSSLFYLYNLPAGFTFACAAAANVVWNAIDAFTANNVNMTLASVENVIAGFLALKATMTYAGPTLNLGGASNATPGGVYQAVCPPTTALERVWDLTHGNCTPAGPEFASVVWNGGSS